MNQLYGAGDEGWMRGRNPGVRCGWDDPPMGRSHAATAVLLVALATAVAAEPAMAAGTKITVSSSEFGRMVWGPKRQAVYAFERDGRKRPRCYGRCAEAWPPVFTKGKPRGGRGVKRSLLGTARRRDGRRQVTYAGKPLYFYAHEDRGEVLCHNVRLNGGLWWVVGRNGQPRP